MKNDIERMYDTLFEKADQDKVDEIIISLEMYAEKSSLKALS